MEIISLNEKIWRAFLIEDLFEVFLPPGDTQADKCESGDIPLVSAGSSNNGICKFIKCGDEKSKLYDSNLISVDMFGQAFFHVYKFYCVSHGRVNLLKPRQEINRYHFMFLCRTINTATKGKFSYNQMCSSKRIARLPIRLPVNDNDEPDFDFMENYMRAVEAKQLQRYRTYAKEKLSALETKKIPPLNEKIWQAFFIKDLFVTIRNGSQIPTGAHVCKENLREGKTPRITVTSNNNGVYGFYNSTDKNYKTYENFISVSFLGDCFYHPYETSLDMKVHCLKLLNRELNEPLALFLVRMLKQMTVAFNYGNQLSSTDIVNKKIQLPVNDSGAPDFKYMEAYVKNLETDKYRKYLNYLNQKDEP